MAAVQAGETGKPVRDGPGFVHLHVHSAYSLLEGAIRRSKLVELAAADGQPALAVTDRNNLFGALEFSEKAAEKGIQPIPGVMLCVDFGFDLPPRPDGTKDCFVVLLAKDATGYANLSRLVGPETHVV